MGADLIEEQTYVFMSIKPIDFLQLIGAISG